MQRPFSSNYSDRVLRRQVWQLIALAVCSAALGVAAAWRAPALELQTRDALVRMRGTLAVPDDIVIVAIDEASLARLGRFPWPRKVLAHAIEKIAAAQPRAIALDVLFSEPTDEQDDAALMEAVAQAGNVVVAAQLIQTDGGEGRQTSWLRALPALESRAAGVGHVNIALDQDGVARALLLRQLDDSAQPFWAMALETVRVGKGLTPSDLREKPAGIQLGASFIPAQFAQSFVPVSGADIQTVRAARLAIDYSGPAGVWATQTVSLVELLNNKIAPERLRNKYVLLGATAATLGDHVVSPFTRVEGADGNQNALPLAGVEILAHSVNTLLRARFYAELSDWQAFVLAFCFAILTMAALTLAQGRWVATQQLGAMLILLALVWAGAYVAFARWLVIVPLVPMLVSGGLSVPLVLLRRAWLASGQLDDRLTELKAASTKLLPASAVFLPDQLRPHPAALIARLSGAQGVALLSRQPNASGYRLLSSFGPALPVLWGQSLEANEALTLPVTPHCSVSEALARPSTISAAWLAGGTTHSSAQCVALRLDQPDEMQGALLVTFEADAPPTPATLQACREVAANYMAVYWQHAQQNSTRYWWNRWLPHSLESKTRQLMQLQQSFLSRAGFLDRALHSMEDGLLIASVDGFITYANPRAAQIFSLSETTMQGQDLFALTGWLTSAPAPSADTELRNILARLLVERAPVEREIVLGENDRRFYHLRLAVVCEHPDQTGAVTGLVATLADISRHRELQQLKNDVMALVTHELRTPLTAIQGMSEVLAQHEFTTEERHEMHQAINDEAKRLARMIDDYLDIARLEAGARPMRREPVRLTTVLERSLLMLEPLARQRDLRLVRRFAPNLPFCLGDADVLGRAVTNLVNNALKFSPLGGEIVVETGVHDKEIWVKVADQGCGIPREDWERIFEKFYRVPRLDVSVPADEALEVPGTGLGLPFVREVAEQHHGRVTVESERGVGSTFTLWLPLPPDN